MIPASALRYSHALADVVLLPGSGLTAEDCLSQMRAFEALLKESPELKGALLSPAVAAPRKQAVVTHFAESLGLGRLVRNFLHLVVSHRRVNLLPAMVEGLEAVLDERAGYARADIATAREIEPALAARIEEGLARTAGRKIRPRYRVEPALVGGAVARVGSTVYDGSVRGQLERLRRSLGAPEAGAVEGR
jgi:F-type H+-transporting ATPase subunit delta